MPGCIFSMAFSCDNQTAFITGEYGNVKILKWKAGANSGDDFDLTKPKKVGGNYTVSICLTKDEKYLLLGSIQLVSVLEKATKKVTKEFKMPDTVIGINLIQDDKKVLIAEENGNLSIIDLETLEISSIAKNITKGKVLSQIIVI